MANRLTSGEALLGAVTIDDDATIGGNLTTTGNLTANGTINLGDAVAFIADPTGGATVDSQARAVIVLILNALDSTGIMADS